MNAKEWEDNPEFWDEEEHGDDDDEEGYNGLNNDVDANNDETFDNAAEWNEDEHEELIARDMILSHRPSPPKQPVFQQQQHVQQQHIHQPVHQPVQQIQPQPQILTVDELERQLFRTSINQNAPQVQTPRAPTEASRRAGWSPFGGKDLFKRDDTRPDDENVEFFARELIKSHRPPPPKQPVYQQTPVHQPLTQPQILTVDELERQLLRTSIDQSALQQRPAPRAQTETSRRAGWSPFGGNDSNPKDEPRPAQKYKDRKENYKDRRENRNYKENYRSNRREPIIIPPQAQLSVISKAKRRHSITAMHPDEFIKDRMPASGEGFRFLRHSQVANNKVKHDGVLTDKERDWLIRIQEKIQADYDNNLDQDYYYLLYFNSSSMTDEAAQKPSGHGVLDRRFIPRERLLYNSGV